MELENRRDWLTRLRERKHHTRETLAAKLEVSPQLIYQWEMGLRNPSRDNRVALALVLGVGVLRHFADEERAMFNQKQTSQVQSPQPEAQGAAAS